MIDVNKWNQMTDEQKLQMCISVRDTVKLDAVSKVDWNLMFDFLLAYVQGVQCVQGVLS